MMKRMAKIVVLLVGCAAAIGCGRSSLAGEGGADATELRGTLWGLSELHGETVELNNESQRPNFILNAEEAQMSGFTGCNRMFGSYELDGAKLSFGMVGATKMACLETMELEREFLEAFQSTAGWSLEDGELSLLDGSGNAVTRFRPEAAP